MVLVLLIFFWWGAPWVGGPQGWRFPTDSGLGGSYSLVPIPLSKAFVKRAGRGDKGIGSREFWVGHSWLALAGFSLSGRCPIQALVARLLDSPDSGRAAAFFFVLFVVSSLRAWRLRHFGSGHACGLATKITKKKPAVVGARLCVLCVLCG